MPRQNEMKCSQCYFERFSEFSCVFLDSLHSASRAVDIDTGTDEYVGEEERRSSLYLWDEHNVESECALRCILSWERKNCYNAKVLY